MSDYSEMSLEELFAEADRISDQWDETYGYVKQTAADIRRMADVDEQFIAELEAVTNAVI